GLLYYNWVLLQKAADSAAVAGASYLPGNPGQAISTAQSYVTQNGVALTEISSTVVSPDDTQLTVQLRRTVPYNFAVILGLFSGSVAVRRRRRFKPSAVQSGSLP